MRAFSNISGATETSGNTIELLVNGDEIFPAMLETIRGAERSLDLLSYIWWGGDITEEMSAALCDRALAGVDCRVLLDAFGSRKMESECAERMRAAGVEIEFFRDLGTRHAFRLNHRTHRRLLIADGRVGLTGGAGIAEEWEGNARSADEWRDNHCRVEGPVVALFQAAFAQSWLETTGTPLVGEERLPLLEPLEGGVPMHLIASRPRLGTTGAAAAYYAAIVAARRTIDVTASYFAPPPAFVDGLEQAARRGVQVRLLVPGAYPEATVVRDSGRSSYERLLAAGARIFEYQPTTLHAKGFVVDGVWSTIGTANFDARSFEINDEVALCVQGAGFAEALSVAFEADLERSVEVDLASWRSRPVVGRIRETLANRMRRQL